MTPATITFPSGSEECSAWHYQADGDAFRMSDGVPCVVMGHGIGATKDCGLDGYAQTFAEAGLDVLAFDYRSFGDSGGEPRQTVSISGQLADFHAAIAAARRLPGVDAARIVLWGVSLGGGHVLAAGARDRRVAAVVALAPMVDGLAAGRYALSHYRPGQLAGSALRAMRSRVARLTGNGGKPVAIVGRPGRPALMSLPGAYEDYLAIAGPTWRNEIDAAAALEVGGYRPVRHAAQLRCPLLVQIADLDRSSPPHAAAKAAVAGRAEVRHYPCDHFDIFTGAWQRRAAEHQVAFLRRQLGTKQAANGEKGKAERWMPSKR